MYILRILSKIFNRLHLPKGVLRMVFGALYDQVIAVGEEPLRLADEQDEDLAPLLKQLPPPPQKAVW